jgi:hypothetical protein
MEDPSGNRWPQLNSRAEKSSEDRNGGGRQAYARWKNRCDTAKSETLARTGKPSGGRRKSEERTSVTKTTATAEKGEVKISAREKWITAAHSDLGIMSLRPTWRSRCTAAQIAGPGSQLARDSSQKSQAAKSKTLVRKQKQTEQVAPDRKWP